MANYELMLIARPDAAEEETDKLLAQMEGVVTSSGGKVGKVEKMGRRRLAYRVRKQREGFYVLFPFEGGGDTVRELERRLKVADSIVKFMTVRMDEEIQRAEKFKTRLSRQETKRPKPKAASAGAPEVEAPAREGQARSE